MLAQMDVNDVTGLFPVKFSTFQHISAHFSSGKVPGLAQPMICILAHLFEGMLSKPQITGSLEAMGPLWHHGTNVPRHGAESKAWHKLTSRGKPFSEYTKDKH